MPLKAALIHGPDPFGTNMKLVLISLMFPSDQVDPVWIRSALLYHRSTYEGDERKTHKLISFLKHHFGVFVRCQSSILKNVTEKVMWNFIFRKYSCH